MLNTTINFRRLKDARYDHGLSVSELSIITGLTEKQINELENGKEGNSFVEYEHRIDCVKRVAEALGINYDQFLSSNEYILPRQDMSSSKKNVEICHKEDLANEFNEVKQEIAKFRVGEFSGSDWKEDDRMDERKKANGNLQSVESIGPIVLMFLYIFFYLLNFV
ncbi:helix-turn-helix transcriptional regulator [Betaproteobacteria bacterium]|nr:helix-turn-helix transcriptional regulator [Betaproteobacteria bacterium]